jgi:3-isopropylmalate/(R)-2-methylmalate dehydratase small subunit
MMEKFTEHTGTMLPLRRSNVDTDQIIPAVYLKRISRTGFADGLFQTWRNDPDFVLNDPAYSVASILVAGTEFGIGSSREHAVWALRDWGFRVVIAPRFGDIFWGNALKEGLLPVELAPATVEHLWRLAEQDPATSLTVDLGARQVRLAGAAPVAAPAWEFPLDDFSRWRLQEGLDDISLTLRYEVAITVYEQVRLPFAPVVT